MIQVETGDSFFIIFDHRDDFLSALRYEFLCQKDVIDLTHTPQFKHALTKVINNFSQAFDNKGSWKMSPNWQGGVFLYKNKSTLARYACTYFYNATDKQIGFIESLLISNESVCDQDLQRFVSEALHTLIEQWRQLGVKQVIYCRNTVLERLGDMFKSSLDTLLTSVRQDSEVAIYHLTAPQYH
mgnify:CR=1 FL=1